METILYLKKIFILLFIQSSLVTYSFAQSNWFWVNPLPQGNTLNSIFFINAYTGYAVGQEGTIIKTTDQGNSWKILKSGTTNYLYSVYFLNPDTGYAVGYGGTILKTTDGGNNWISQSGASHLLM